MKLHNRNILRISDASEGASLEADPMDTPVNDIDTSFPVLQAAIYELAIEKATVEPNRAQTGELLILRMKTLNEATSTKNESVPSGYSLTKRVAVTPTADYTPDMIKRNIARATKGLVDNTVSAKQLLASPQILDGKTGKWNVSVRKPTPEFPNPSNDVGDIVNRA
jgi:hypothetical protein